MDSYIVAYDTSDPKRLRKVAHTCEDYGYQYLFADYPQPTLFDCEIGCITSSI